MLQHALEITECFMFDYKFPCKIFEPAFVCFLNQVVKTVEVWIYWDLNLNIRESVLKIFLAYNSNAKAIYSTKQYI